MAERMKYQEGFDSWSKPFASWKNGAGVQSHAGFLWLKPLGKRQHRGLTIEPTLWLPECEWDVVGRNV